MSAGLGQPSKGAATAFRIDFVDPLFAVVLHVGFVHTVLALGMVDQWPQLYSAHAVSFADVAVLVLGFANILLSWHGYHRSVLDYPIKGGVRFYLDVLCLLVYVLVVLCFRNLLAVAWLLVAQFLFYWIWDLAKACEYPGLGPSLRAGRKTLGWGLVFIVVAIFATLMRVYPVVEEYAPPAKWGLIIVLWLGTTLYRFFKAKRDGMTLGATVDAWLFGPREETAKPADGSGDGK